MNNEKRKKLHATHTTSQRVPYARRQDQCIFKLCIFTGSFLGPPEVNEKQSMENALQRIMCVLVPRTLI